MKTIPNTSNDAILAEILPIISAFSLNVSKLTLTVVQPHRIGARGSSETFSEMITNNTDADIFVNDFEE